MNTNNNGGGGIHNTNVEEFFFKKLAMKHHKFKVVFDYVEKSFFLIMLEIKKY